MLDDDKDKTYELHAGTQAHMLALSMQESYLHCDQEIEKLQRKADELNENRNDKLQGLMKRLMKELGIEGDPKNWYIDARYLREHGRAYVLRKAGIPTQMDNPMVSEAIN